MSAEAVGWVFRNSPMRGEALLVHLAVADVVNDAYRWEFWMTMPALAEKAHVSRGTASRTMTKLREAGFLDLLEEGGGRGNPSRWQFLMPAETARQTHGLPEEGSVNRAPGDAETARLEEETARLDPSSPLYQPKEPNGDTNGSRKLATFDAFWEVYPRHTGKGAARKAWAAATKKVEARVICNAAVRFAHDPNLPEPQFIPHASTWLNQERWADDPLPPRQGRSRQERASSVLQEAWQDATAAEQGAM